VQNLDPKLLQIALTGFLEKNTSLFVKVHVQFLACVNPELACIWYLAMWNLHPLQSRVSSHIQNPSDCSLHFMNIETRQACADAVLCISLNIVGMSAASVNVAEVQCAEAGSCICSPRSCGLCWRAQVSTPRAYHRRSWMTKRRNSESKMRHKRPSRSVLNWSCNHGMNQMQVQCCLSANRDLCTV
jgi:hypothetical protein